MALIVEDGTGVQNAASYAAVASIDAYWADRAHDANAAVWAALDTGDKEGAAREATSFLDANYGQFYKGQRKGYVQGLLWPRTAAKDETGYPLPDLPPELAVATAELAVRASAARLSPDADRANAVKRIKEKLGPLEAETEYMDGASLERRFGVIDGIMAPLLIGGAEASWAWR